MMPEDQPMDVGCSGHDRCSTAALDLARSENLWTEMARLPTFRKIPYLLFYLRGTKPSFPGFSNIIINIIIPNKDYNSW